MQSAVFGHPAARHDRMVVVARFNEDVSWVPDVAAGWPEGGAVYVVYEKARPGSAHNVPVNKGAEASAYLRFVLDHYERLPEWSFFVHANLTAWHHDGTLGERLAHAWLAVASGRTYVDINNYRQPAGLDKARGPLLSADEPEPSRRVTAEELDEWRREFLEPHVDFDSAPADWVRGSVCCAQFLVHRSQIEQHPRSMYERLYEWSIDPARDDYVEGRFLEYAWHVIWGDAVARDPDPSLHACGDQPAPGQVVRPCTRYEKARRDVEYDEL